MSDVVKKIIDLACSLEGQRCKLTSVKLDDRGVESLLKEIPPCYGSLTEGYRVAGAKVIRVH